MDALPVAATLLVAFIVSLGGAWVARRAGLGDISDKLEARFESFIQQQDRELAKKDAEIIEALRQRDEATTREIHLREELVQVKRDLRLTEAELLDLYRKTGEKPPSRLVELP